MNLSRLFKWLILFVLVVTLLADEEKDLSSSRRRRRRRRRHRNPDGTIRRTSRRIRHTGSKRRMEFVQNRLPKSRGKRTPYDGRIRLVDGRGDYEGNVEIFHDGKWGNICDDEWDLREAEIVCKELGFPDAIKVTYNGHYGHVRHEYWMDNLFCGGEEKRLKDCRHDGWGRHDCERNEAAGVVCETETSTTVAPQSFTETPKDAPEPVKKEIIQNVRGAKIKLRLRGGRIENEGRVEVKLQSFNSWGLICGDDWSLLEAMVVCRQLGLKYAQSAPSTGYFGGNSSDLILSGVKCNGNEDSISECLQDVVKEVNCPGPIPNSNIAGVTCVDRMADLAPDLTELTRTVHVVDTPLSYLQCAMEENCLASPAYSQKESETRSLLRFTSGIFNKGDKAFRPMVPKEEWEWHQCHMHYHSMAVFAHYDITDADGKRVAEGHKASFCLEDKNCRPGIIPFYKCENFNDQGISPGCTDTYAYNIDCQWIDVTEVPAGTYIFKLSVNPEFKVAEKTFENNEAVCDLIYGVTSAWLGNCTLARPSAPR